MELVVVAGLVCWLVSVLLFVVGWLLWLVAAVGGVVVICSLLVLFDVWRLVFGACLCDVCGCCCCGW